MPSDVAVERPDTRVGSLELHDHVSTGLHQVGIATKRVNAVIGQGVPVAVPGAERASGGSALDAAVPVLSALVELEARRNATPPPGFDHLDLSVPLSIGIVRAGDWASTVGDMSDVEI